MEALIWKSAACLRPSSHKFRKDNCPLASPSCLVFGLSACFRRALSSRNRLAHAHSRCLGGGHFNEDGRISGPQRERTSRPARRANPEEIGLHCSNPSEDDTDDEAGAVRENSVKKVIQALGAFASANFLIVALSCAIFFGLAWSAPGRAAQQLGLTKWCTSAIFLLSGLNIRSGDADQGASAWPAGLFGLVSILVITPLAAVPILCLQSSPREFVVGLAMFACVPTTLSSAAAMTQIAGANTTLAIGMTVLSNLISIVTMPFTLTALVGGGTGVSIAPRQLLQSLIQTLLIPLVLGKPSRLWPALWLLLVATVIFLTEFGVKSKQTHIIIAAQTVQGSLILVATSGIIVADSGWFTFTDIAKLVDGNRRRMSMLSGAIQGLVPWMQLSTSKELLLRIDPSNLLVVSAAGLALHISYLVTNSVLMRLCPSPCLQEDYNSRAVLLASSQKSVVVCIAVIDRLGGAFGNAGLLVLPCVAAQFSQVIVDSILVNSWLQHDARERLRLSST